MRQPFTYAVTTSSEQARLASQASQRTADEFRRAGAGDAARQAQVRADAYAARAEKKPATFL